MQCLINTKTSKFFKDWWKKYFDVIEFDAHCISPDISNLNTFVIVDNVDRTIDHWVDQEFKTVILYAWDQFVDDIQPPRLQAHCLALKPKNFIWIHFAQNWKSQNYQYLRHVTDPEKFFLMLINKQKLHRDELFNKTKLYHDISLYSYVDRGHYIENDVPPTGTPFQSGTSDQNFYNPDWYSRTGFSMVSESEVTSDLFISEKIFKPIAFQHAFLVYGSPGTLRYLKESGFETFDHVLDETYDKIQDQTRRLQAIVDQLAELQHLFDQKTLFNDSVSKQKILHNYHRFYDIQEKFEFEIVNPIKNFIES